MIPISIVTGFLGSGKTTLIARLLRNPDFARTAVIVNEFGEIGLDHDLIVAGDETLVTLTTGCICCRVRSDLIATLLDLDRRRIDQEIPGYDRVLIETSGLADPAPILQALISDRDVNESHTIDTVLTLVDALHGGTTLERYPEARRQVAVADQLIITKSDQIAEVPEQLFMQLTAANPCAPVLTAVKGDIAPDRLFAGAVQMVRASRLATLPAKRAATPFLQAVHRGGIETFTLERDRPIPALALALWLQGLAEHCGAKLLRLKGLVEVQELPDRPAVIHVVRHSISEPEWLDRWPTLDHTNRIVFICEGVPRHFPVRLLDAIEHEVRS